MMDLHAGGVAVVTDNLGSVESSAADAVVKVGDAVVTFANADPLQLALFDAQVAGPRELIHGW
jgi:hypothetical protein